MSAYDDYENDPRLPVVEAVLTDAYLRGGYPLAPEIAAAKVLAALDAEKVTHSPEAVETAKAVLNPSSVYSAGSAYREARILARAVLDA